MDGACPSFEGSHDQWLTLSLSIAPQPQPQPPQRRPQPQLLPLLEPQPQPPSLPAPFHYMPFVAPTRPFSLPQEQERYMPAPPTPPPSPPVQVHDLPEMRLLPKCDFPFQDDQDQDDAGQTCQSGKRKLPVRARAKKKGKTGTIDPPFPWATTTRATVHSLEHLLAHNIKSISGAVKCKGCHEQYDIEFDLEEKFREVARFVLKNKCNMHQRAPDAWTIPVLPTCKRCGQVSSLSPVIIKKRNINWLFLLLGQMLGCCNLSHLKYFCKHTANHRTAAKDRLIYLTYLGLCKQLQPEGPFDP